ncbi:MAG: class I SAM-dependent methyltransferase [bacterium]
MGRWRRRYYDLFSRIYDLIIRLHSKDEGAALRDFLVTRTGMGRGDRVLDICTGTGSVALAAHAAVAPEGMVVGLDFSFGMLGKASQKARERGLSRMFLIVGDAAAMPFRTGAFGCVTCSHAMYELPSDARTNALGEVQRVLADRGRFFMMEHCKPTAPFIRFFYYVRLMSMGSPENRRFAEDETPFIERFFREVTMEPSPTGKSKLISGVK